MVKNRRLFISHSWSYDDTYDRLCEMLDAAHRFRYSNYSVPKAAPITNAPTQTALKQAIKQQMAPCHVVIVLAGKYATYSEWLNKEIALAKREFDKPVLAITPRGAQRISVIVRDDADLIVKWNATSIVQGLRELAPSRQGGPMKPRQKHKSRVLMAQGHRHPASLICVRQVQPR